MDDEFGDLVVPIKFVIKRDISQNHRIMCPYCQEFIDLTTKILISHVSGGFSFSIEHYMADKRLQEKVKPEILEYKSEQLI